jgi:hypothetical protein
MHGGFSPVGGVNRRSRECSAMPVVLESDRPSDYYLWSLTPRYGITPDAFREDGAASAYT